MNWDRFRVSIFVPTACCFHSTWPVKRQFCTTVPSLRWTWFLYQPLVMQMKMHHFNQKKWRFPIVKIESLQTGENRKEGQDMWGVSTQKGSKPVCCSKTAWGFHSQTCSRQNPSVFVEGRDCRQKAGTSPTVKCPYLAVRDKAFRHFLFVTHCPPVSGLYVYTHT